MIFDRTMDDVQQAVKIRDTKIKAFTILSTAEINTLERGMLLISTLNRIEDKQKELKSLFGGMGYWDVHIENKYWGFGSVFDETEFRRIIDNTNVLRDAFFVYVDTPATPPPSYYYEDINALEKILYDLEMMTNEIKSRYRICGAYICGED